jgi:ABC-type branched-subunit amino acid transport system permease subunit
VSAGTQLYTTTILTYAAVYAVGALGLSVQYSYAGIVNFAYIVLQAAGAYTTAILTLGPSSQNFGFQQYILGWRLPFPVPILAAMAVGAALAVLLGSITLRRLRRDYQAMSFLVISIIATDVIENQKGIFNGQAGLSLIPAPLSGALHLSPLGYRWAYSACALVIAALVFLLVRYVGRSPLGLAWRATRDHEVAAEALGKDTSRLNISAMALGGAIAGLSGALLVEFITVWSPNAWLFPETFVFFTALLVGGMGNDWGVLAGVIAVPIRSCRLRPSFRKSSTPASSTRSSG